MMGDHDIQWESLPETKRAMFKRDDALRYEDVALRDQAAASEIQLREAEVARRQWHATKTAFSAYVAERKSPRLPLS